MTAIGKLFKEIEHELSYAVLLGFGIDPQVTDRQEERYLNAAVSRYGHRGCTLIQAGRELLSLQTTPHPRNNPDLIRAAYFSGGMGIGVLDGAMRVALTTGFSSVSDTAAGWVSSKECESFKAERRTHIRAGENLERLARGGSAKRDFLDLETAEEYRCNRFAKTFTVNDELLAGDDAAVIFQKAQQLGSAAARTRLDLVFARLLANEALDADSTALFHADHSNLNAGSALSSTTLRDGVAAMMKQQEGNISVNPIPRFLICPPDLALTGAELLRNLSLPSGRNLTLISDARLANGVTDPASGTAYAGSTSSWYLSASGAQAPTVEVGYVDSPKPQLSSWTKTGEDGQWLIGWSVKLDIGAKVLSYLGLQRNDS